MDSLSPKSITLLSWTHYRVLLQVNDPKVRAWYEKEAIEQIWSVRTLQRNISSQYYYRMLQTQQKELVESEMKDLTAEINILFSAAGKQGQRLKETKDINEGILSIWKYRS